MKITRDGIIPLHKQAGMTSHDCVVKLRKILQTKRVGHTGTLDPSVSGVLPICINRATKVAEYMSAYDKTYEATVAVGTATTTEDQTGEIIESSRPELFSEDKVQAVLQSFEGEIEQIPPMYSAVKIKGKKLYEYAREGITIERPSRTIRIVQLKLLSPPERNEDDGNVEFKIRVTCSKGTYIRTLAVDIGKALGYPAHMSSLVRTQSGPFSIQDAVTLEELGHVVEAGNLSDVLLPIEKALSIFPSIEVSGAVEQKILNGSLLEETKELSNPRTAVYNGQGECLAIYIPHPDRQGWVKPEKVLKIQNRT
ncbi:tRNA pseudouridine(55) synthase TruB [Bacillus sp. Marseille-Q3570]|uniref:tRNA pseudouridine(55) synthase TruB n=1 Tax=Bacillus sp. Marseille-Q3570 TaxID=2963522 RepID=UPI0021B751A7|nr:tRNA pseudouridine(55) synthase TruB [Bacillus sp. Marseille-Q3570]